MLHLYLPGGIDGYFVEWQEALAAGASEEEWGALAARNGLSYANEQR